METIKEVKDYEMDYKYAIDNFLGLSIDEQISLLTDMKKVAKAYSLRTDNNRFYTSFIYAFGSYLDTITNICLVVERYQKLDNQTKKVYSVNVINNFYRECQKELDEIYKKEDLDDDLEYNIICDYYKFPKDYTMFTNPDRIYLQDLVFHSVEDKEMFCGNLTLAYYNRNLFQIPMQKRLIEIIEPMLLDIYGEELYNYIKSFHHSFTFSVIDKIVTYHMPDTSDEFRVAECHKYFQGKTDPNNLLDEDLEEARRSLIELEQSFKIFPEEQKEY